jgi:hypothetical protein
LCFKDVVKHLICRRSHLQSEEHIQGDEHRHQLYLENFVLDTKFPNFYNLKSMVFKKKSGLIFFGP